MLKQYQLKIETNSEILFDEKENLIFIPEDLNDDEIPSIPASMINGMLIHSAISLSKQNLIQIPDDFDIQLLDAYLEGWQNIIDKEYFLSTNIFKSIKNETEDIAVYQTLKPNLTFHSILAINEAHYEFVKKVCENVKTIGLKTNLGYGQVTLNIKS